MGPTRDNATLRTTRAHSGCGPWNSGWPIASPPRKATWVSDNGDSDVLLRGTFAIDDGDSVGLFGSTVFHFRNSATWQEGTSKLFREFSRLAETGTRCSRLSCCFAAFCSACQATDITAINTRQKWRILVGTRSTLSRSPPPPLGISDSELRLLRGSRRDPASWRAAPSKERLTCKRRV